MKNYFKNIWYFLRLVFRNSPWTYSLLILSIIITQSLPFYVNKIQADIVDGIINFVNNPELFSENGVYILVLFYALTKLVTELFNSLRGLLSSSGTYKTNTAFEFIILKKFLSLDVATYEDPEFKKLVQASIDNGQQWSLVRLGHTTIFQLSSSAVKLIISASIILVFDWKLFLFIFLAEMIPTLNRVFFEQKEYILWSKSETETQIKYFHLRNHIRGVTGRIELKIYQVGEFFLKQIKNLYDLTTGQVHKYEQKMLAFFMLSDFITTAAYGWAIYKTVEYTLNGDITVGYMTFIFGAIFSAGSAVGSTFNAVADITDQNRYATLVKQFIETEPILKTDSPVDNLNSFELDKAPVIEFKNVTFKYPKQSKEDKEPVLKNINLIIKTGEKIGLMGDNGAGKSTLIKLLLRIYDPTEGDIFANGVNIKNIPPNIWQRYISALMQSYSSYDFKIKDAIAVSDDPDNIDIDRVIEASRKSQAFKFIEKYEHGHEAQLGKDLGGVEPSGGQRQKLALARTFYRKAPIVILDEPTAAIDTESEIEIFKTLDGLGKDVTAIFISHDMATIQRADRVIVIEDGKVTEDGTHKELMKNKTGKYRTMYDEQMRAMKGR